MTAPPPCVILAGGDAALPDRPLPGPAFVIAADGGLHLAERLGLTPDLVVGDMDSVDRSAVGAAEAAGAKLDRHPTDKDATDLELALDAALARGFERVIVIGGAALDRIDHLLAVSAVLASGRYQALHPSWWVGPATVVPVHDRAELQGTPGDLVSLLPVGGDAEVSTAGLRWELHHDTLEHGTGRGVSNELVDFSAVVEVSAGTVLAIHTGGHLR